MDSDRAVANASAPRARLYLSPPHLGQEELRFVLEAFESNYIAPVGPMVDAFEQEMAEYMDFEACVAVSSGTAAMHLALRCLGVEEGDEVFASTLTFIGGVTPVIFQGATPVFIDSDRESWNLNPDLLEEELERCSKRGRLPKVVVPTDLYGQCCNLPRIVGICARYDVPVVVDAAEAMGARYRRGDGTNSWVHAGKEARAAVFSFNGNKLLTTSGGGMLASDDAGLVEEAGFLSRQARDIAPHYEHSRIGYNYRLSNILAAIGRGQLRVLEDRVRRKREIFALYQEALGDLPGVDFMPEAPWSRSNRWLTVILVDPKLCGVDREGIRRALEEENIEARPVWKPMHQQPVFRPNAASQESRGRASDHGGTRSVTKPAEPRRAASRCGSRLGGKSYRCRVVGGEVAEELFLRGLCLPSGTAMSDSDVERVANVIRRVLGAAPL